MKEERKCLTCGEVLFGRADKKFCNDNCRGIYNNKKNKMGDDYFRKVNSILRKNRRILEEMNPKEKSKPLRKSCC